jgi:hypothetical protein
MHVDGFPYSICRPCKRRLNNTISFKNVISETQKSLVKDPRSKRYPEVSPSVARPCIKVTAVGSRSLALDFVNVSSTSDETRSVTPLAMPIEVSQLFMNIIYLPIYFTVIH